MGEDGKRRHTRVRDDIPVFWRIEDSDLQGQGILRDISISGARLETRALIAVRGGMEVLLRAVESVEKDFVPPSARLVWGKGAREGRGYFFYGLEFQRVEEVHRSALSIRVGEKLKSVSFGLGSGITDTITWPKE